MKRFAIVALVAAAGVVPTGLAQTVPPWARNGTGALNPMVTCVEWTRASGTSGFDQSHWSTPGLTHGPALPDTSFSAIEPIFGVSNQANSTQFTITLPNFIDNLPVKLFWVDFRTNSLSSQPFDISLDWNNGGTTGTVPPSQLGLNFHSTPSTGFTSKDPNGSPWWIFEPNPDYETLSFRVPHTFDQPPVSGLSGITIYTISIPSAGSVALMAAGLPLVLRRRR